MVMDPAAPTKELFFLLMDRYQIVAGGLQVSHILFGHFANVIPHCIFACMVSENWGVILILVPFR